MGVNNINIQQPHNAIENQAHLTTSNGRSNKMVHGNLKMDLHANLKIYNNLFEREIYIKTHPFKHNIA